MAAGGSVYRTDEDEVLRLGQAVRRRDRLRQQLAWVETEYARHRRSLAGLTAKLASEEADVARLEARGLTWLLWSAMGREEAKLEQERQEALDAALRVQAARADVEETQAEVERLRSELSAFDNVDADYDRAFRAKVGRIIAEAGPKADAMRRYIDAVHGAERVLREIDEALEAGRWAERYLGEALSAIKAIEDEEAAAIAATTVIITMAFGNPHATRLESTLLEGQRRVRRYVLELHDVPVPDPRGWDTTLLVSFIGHFSQHRGVKAARNAKAGIRSVLARVRETQRALTALRVQAAEQYQAALHQYRYAVENG